MVLSQEEMVTTICGVVLTTQELTVPENMGCSVRRICFADINENWLVITGFSWKDLKHHRSPKPLASVTLAREEFLVLVFLSM